MPDVLRRHWPFILLIVLLTLGVAAGGALVSGGSSDPWYVALDKPSLTPPGFVFGIVWPILYALMAIGASLALVKSGSFAAASGALAVYFSQLVLNLSWSWAFFGFHRPLVALIIILALWLLIAAMINAFAKFSKAAALMQLPYILWVSFAAYLNGYIVIAN